MRRGWKVGLGCYRDQIGGSCMFTAKVLGVGRCYLMTSSVGNGSYRFDRKWNLKC